MDYFKNFFNQNDIPINQAFANMSKEELLTLIYSLKEVNEKQKEKLNKLSKENAELKEIKDSMMNKKKNDSEIKNIYKDLKYTLFSFNETEVNEKNKNLNDFIYDQYLLYDGLEEEEVNDLNQIKKIDDNLENNKELFIFKQKIIERNYQELFRNMEASSQLQKIFYIKNENEIIINDNDKNKECTVIENKDKNDENNIKEIKDNNNGKEKNEENDKKKENVNEIKEENIKGIKSNSLSDKKLDGKKKSKKHKKKEKEKEKENEEEKMIKKESAKLIQNKMNIESLNPIKKKEEKNYLLDALLEDENDDDNKISFKNINDDNKNKGWEEE